MSMTIDHLRQAGRAVAFVVLLVLGWFAVLSLPMLAGAEPPAILVLGPAPDLVSRLGPDVVILAETPVGLVLQSDRPGLAVQLWRAGARLLLPAGLTGCASPSA
jgi:hypothetical protein